MYDVDCNSFEELYLSKKILKKNKLKKSNLKYFIFTGCVKNTNRTREIYGFVIFIYKITTSLPWYQD